MKEKRTSEAIDRLMDIMEMIESLKEGNFTGYVRIDFNRGMFSKVERFEEIMKKK